MQAFFTGMQSSASSSTFAERAQAAKVQQEMLQPPMVMVSMGTHLGQTYSDLGYCKFYL
jgi:hypothetical protein